MMVEPKYENINDDAILCYTNDFVLVVYTHTCVIWKSLNTIQYQQLCVLLFLDDVCNLS